MTLRVVSPTGQRWADLFDGYVEGPKTFPSNRIIELGTDVRDKYAPIIFGQKGPDVGVIIEETGLDVSNYFAAKGTAKYWPEPPWDRQFSNAAQAITPNSATARLLFRLNSQGNLVVLAGNTSPTQLINERFIPAFANPADIEVRAFNFTGTGPLQNTMLNWTPLVNDPFVEYKQTQSGVGSSFAETDMTVEARYIDRPTSGVSAVTTLRIDMTVQEVPQ